MYKRDYAMIFPCRNIYIHLDNPTHKLDITTAPHMAIMSPSLDRRMFRKVTMFDLATVSLNRFLLRLETLV